MQHVYAFKHSGEFRVRAVARGDRQHPSTVTLTFAPTASMLTVRIFYLIAIEETHTVINGDVPQAFLQGKQDTTLFLWAPKSQRTFPGEIYQVLLPLYGFRSSAAYWFRECRVFLESLGFVMDPMAVCHFRKFLDDECKTFVQLVLVVDDYAMSGPEQAVQHYHSCMEKRFNATTESGKMFVGYDVDYNLAAGYVKISFTSYIARMVERFSNVDLSKGAPMRELIGCLCWTTMNLHAAEIIRVKSHSAFLNTYTALEYDDAVATMHKVAALAPLGIVYRRGGAAHIFVPPAARPGKTLKLSSPSPAPHAGHYEAVNEFEERDLYTDEDVMAESRYAKYPVNDRYVITQHADSAFAVDTLMRSITGAITLVNGGPVLWHCTKESLLVDSTTSSETLSYSTGLKDMKYIELRFKFFHIQPPKPYKMYTDSTGGKTLACNPNKLGRVRHLNIRNHMIKCYIQIGDIELVYCCTEACLADLCTKICDAEQRRNLGHRFYNDCVFSDGRFYKTPCYEHDHEVRITISAQPLVSNNTSTSLQPSLVSPEWTVTQLDRDLPNPTSDPRWCSVSATMSTSNC